MIVPWLRRARAGVHEVTCRNPGTTCHLMQTQIPSRLQRDSGMKWSGRNAGCSHERGVVALQGQMKITAAPWQQQWQCVIRLVPGSRVQLWVGRAVDDFLRLIASSKAFHRRSLRLESESESEASRARDRLGLEESGSCLPRDLHLVPRLSPASSRTFRFCFKSARFVASLLPFSFAPLALVVASRPWPPRSPRFLRRASASAPAAFSFGPGGVGVGVGVGSAAAVASSVTSEFLRSSVVSALTVGMSIVWLGPRASGFSTESCEGPGGLSASSRSSSSSDDDDETADEEEEECAAAAACLLSSKDSDEEEPSVSFSISFEEEMEIACLRAKGAF